MTFTILVEDKASSEVREASEWYFNNSPLASVNFEKEIYQSLKLLKTSIIEHREVLPGLKAFPLKIFPYIIYYRRLDERNIIQIVALLHNKRGLDYILNRLLSE